MAGFIKRSAASAACAVFVPRRHRRRSTYYVVSLPSPLLSYQIRALASHPHYSSIKRVGSPTLAATPMGRHRASVSHTAADCLGESLKRSLLKNQSTHGLLQPSFLRRSRSDSLGRKTSHASPSHSHRRIVR